MSPTKATTTALERLEALRAAVRSAVVEVGEAQSAARRAASTAEAAKRRLLDYYEAVTAGEAEADAAREQELIDEAQGVEAMALRAEPDGRSTRLVAFNERLEAEHRGAQRAVEAAGQAVARFISEHREELASELLPRSLAARDRLLEAWEELQGASGAWGAARAAWSPLLERWGDLGALPQNPLAGATDELERAFAPLQGGVPRDPRRLVPAPLELVPDPREEAPGGS